MNKKRTGLLVLITVIFLVLAGIGGNLKDKDKSASEAKPDGSNIPIISATSSIGEPNTGDVFKDLFTAQYNFTIALKEVEEEPLDAAVGIYLNLAKVYAFNADGTFSKDGRFGFLIQPQGSTTCFSDFKENISALLVYDAIPDWSGKEARVYLFSTTLCDAALNENAGSFKTDEGYINVEAGPLLTPVPGDDEFLLAAAKSLQESPLAANIVKAFLDQPLPDIE